ncbi:MAG: FHA domain-containing protein, partial [Cyanobacteria bacterium J06641_5]
MLLRIENSSQAWKLQPERVYTLGRNPDRDIRLDAPGISRMHAELYWDGVSWCLRDCKSVQGTYIGDRRIQEAPLEPEQPFRLGTDSEVWLELKPEAAEAASYQPPPPPTRPYSLANFRGHTPVKEELKRYADLILDANLAQPVQGILLQAGSGRGKRFLCSCLADQLSQERGQTFQFISRDLSDAYNPVQARQFIRKWLKECVKHAPAVLLLQNFETFYEHLEPAEDEQGDRRDEARARRLGKTVWWHRLVSGMGFADLRSAAERARALQEQLHEDIDTYWQWNLNEKSPILVIASVTSLVLLPPEIRKPGEIFSFVQSLPKPDLEGRIATLETFLSEVTTPLSSALKLPELAQRLGRIDGNDIEQIVRDAERHCHQARAPFLRWEDFQPFLPKTTDQIWAPIFLPEPVLQSLQQQAARSRAWDVAIDPG